MNEFLILVLVIPITALIISLVILQFAYMYRTRVNMQIVRSRMHEDEAHIELRKKALLQSLNEHFIYNSFGAINGEMLVDPRSAARHNSLLAKHVRYTMESLRDDGLSDLQRELECIRGFCELQKLRFGDRINVIYNIESDNFDLPYLSVQPYVECAIRLGLRRGEMAGTVAVAAHDIDKKHVITITNDGTGYLNDLDADTRNLLEATEFRIRSQVDGTVKTVNVPQKCSVVTIFIPTEDAGI